VESGQYPLTDVKFYITFIAEYISNLNVFIQLHY